MEKNNRILEVLNAIGPAWADQFETTPEICLAFQASGAGMLVLNGNEVCAISDIEPSSVYTDVEFFGFFTNDGVEYRFHVDWSCDSAPCVKRFSRITVTDSELCVRS